MDNFLDTFVPTLTVGIVLFVVSMIWILIKKSAEWLDKKTGSNSDAEQDGENVANSKKPQQSIMKEDAEEEPPQQQERSTEITFKQFLFFLVGAMTIAVAFILLFNSRGLGMSLMGSIFMAIIFVIIFVSVPKKKWRD